MILSAIAVALVLAQAAEATSLNGKLLMRPTALPNQQKLEADLAQAEKDLAAGPNDAEAMIWVSSPTARRTRRVSRAARCSSTPAITSASPVTCKATTRRRATLTSSA